MSSTNHNTTTHIHRSVPAYLSAIRKKVAEFGREELTAYSKPRSLCLGFQCKDEIHMIGVNAIRAHYKIERVLPDIPHLVISGNDSTPTISQDSGIEMFMKDCGEALNGLPQI
jgi:hypothetical protein